MVLPEVIIGSIERTLTHGYEVVGSPELQVLDLSDVFRLGTTDRRLVNLHDAVGSFCTLGTVRGRSVRVDEEGEDVRLGGLEDVDGMDVDPRVALGLTCESKARVLVRVERVEGDVVGRVDGERGRVEVEHRGEPLLARLDVAADEVRRPRRVVHERILARFQAGQGDTLVVVLVLRCSEDAGKLEFGYEERDEETRRGDDREGQDA